MFEFAFCRYCFPFFVLRSTIYFFYFFSFFSILVFFALFFIVLFSLSLLFSVFQYLCLLCIPNCYCISFVILLILDAFLIMNFGLHFYFFSRRLFSLYDVRFICVLLYLSIFFLFSYFYFFFIYCLYLYSVFCDCLLFVLFQLYASAFVV